MCDDFLTYDFNEKFDVIYSSLTFMHIENKQEAINKVSSLLNKMEYLRCPLTKTNQIILT